MSLRTQPTSTSASFDNVTESILPQSPVEEAPTPDEVDGPVEINVEEEEVAAVRNPSITSSVGSRIRSKFMDIKHQGKREFMKLIFIMVVLLAALVCIAKDIEKTFFISVFSMLIGLVCDSPLTVQHGAGATGGK